MANGSVVTNGGRKIAMHRTFETSPTLTNPSVFKVGTGTTTPSIVDTDLTTPITIAGNPTKAIASTTFDDSNLVVTNRAILLTTECNGNNIAEFGLQNTDGSPILFSHSVFTAVSKTASVQMIFVEKDYLT